MTPTVAIVIPSIRGPQAFTRILRSLRNQTVPPDEILIVQDSVELVDQESISSELANLPVRILASGTSFPIGPGGARNIGISNCESEIVFPVDDDDELLPYAICAVKEAFLQWPDTDILVAPFWEEVGDGRWINSCGEVTVRNILLGQCRLLGCSPFRRAMWKGINGYSSRPDVVEDIDFFLRGLLSGARLCLMEFPLYCWIRSHDGRNSVMASKTSRVECLKHFAQYYSSANLEYFYPIQRLLLEFETSGSIGVVAQPHLILASVRSLFSHPRECLSLLRSILSKNSEQLRVKVSE